MLYKEFRVILPMTVEEYQVAQLYSVIEASKQETGGGDGVEIKVNEPFDDNIHTPVPALLGGDDRFKTGQYTNKVYHLASKVPAFVKAVAPASALNFNEEAWNAYPYCKTVVTNDYMKDDFIISIESLHVNDDINLINPHQLDVDIYNHIEKVYINIADLSVHRDFKEDEDPTKFKSEKTGRGPLIGEWWKNNPNLPVMCAYKLVRCKFKWWGLQSQIEKMIMKNEHRIFTNFHRQSFCWMDRWYGLTMVDIRRMEAEVKDELAEQRIKGELRGHVAE